MSSAVVGENLGALINAPLDTVGGAWLSRYSRGQESESDRIGIRTAAEAGYNPAALADMLLRLEKDVASQTGRERRFSIFDSHPMTETRLKDIRSRAATLTPARDRSVAPNSASLFPKLEGIWWGENPEEGLFQRRPVFAAHDRVHSHPAGRLETPEHAAVCDLGAPQQEAMLLLGIAGPAADPEVVGERFIQKMRTKARTEPVSTRKGSVGDFACICRSVPGSVRASAGLSAFRLGRHGW